MEGMQERDDETENDKATNVSLIIKSILHKRFRHSSIGQRHEEEDQRGRSAEREILNRTTEQVLSPLDKMMRGNNSNSSIVNNNNEDSVDSNKTVLNSRTVIDNSVANDEEQLDVIQELKPTGGDRNLPINRSSTSYPHRHRRQRQRQQEHVTPSGRTLALTGRSAKSRRNLMEENASHKISRTLDLETGMDGGARAQVAVIRQQQDATPQCRRRRMRRKMERQVEQTFNSNGRRSSHFDAAAGAASMDAADDEEDEDFDNETSQNKKDKENKRNKERSTWKETIFRTNNSRKRQRCHDDEPGAGDENQSIRSLDDGRQEEVDRSWMKSQYQILSLDVNEEKKKKTSSKWYGRGLYGELAANDEDTSASCCYVNPNEMIVSYLFWTFRSTFIAVLLSAALWFYLWTLLFAILIYIIGHNLPQCINVAEFDFSYEETFLNAYALSWTTFSTVGYGAIHPATSETSFGVYSRACTSIKLVMGIEAFVGVLFASFWGAIFLSKVTRTARFAQIDFSEALTIRYGSGVAPTETKIDCLDEEDSNSGIEPPSESTSLQLQKSDVESCRRIPCPVLEFRVYNNLQKQKRGEIIDAVISVVATIDDAQKVKSGSGRRLRTGHVEMAKSHNLQNQSDSDDAKSIDSGNPQVKDIDRMKRILISKLNGGDDEGERYRSSKRTQNIEQQEKIFTKIKIESPEHPFFKRLWTVTHVLDHESPLLRPEARSLIKQNDGYWPIELNSARALRKSVCFDQLLVSLSGTSNVDANKCHKLTVYNYSDLVIGYKFVDALSRQNDGSLAVDPSLLDVVEEQDGGGGEVLNLDQSRHAKEILVL